MMNKKSLLLLFLFLALTSLYASPFQISSQKTTADCDEVRSVFKKLEKVGYTADAFSNLGRKNWDCPEVLKAYFLHEDPEVRNRAWNSVIFLVEKKTCDQLNPFFEKGLLEGDPQSKMNVLTFINLRNCKDQKDLLIRNVFNEENPITLFHYVSAIKKLATKEDLPTLIKLQDKNNLRAKEKNELAEFISKLGGKPKRSHSAINLINKVSVGNVSGFLFAITISSFELIGAALFFSLFGGALLQILPKSVREKTYSLRKLFYVLGAIFILLNLSLFFVGIIASQLGVTVQGGIAGLSLFLSVIIFGFLFWIINKKMKPLDTIIGHILSSFGLLGTIAYIIYFYFLMTRGLH